MAGETPSGNSGSLSRNFKADAAKGYYEARAQEAPDMGNVFAAINGDDPNHATFMIQQEAHRAANSGGVSSVAVASAMAGQFAGAAKRAQEKQKESDARLSMHVALMNALRDRLDDLNERLGDVRENIEATDRAIDRIISGEFDPDADEEDAAWLTQYLQAIEMTREEWDGLTQAEQIEAATDYRDGLVEHAEDLEQIIDIMREDLALLENVDPDTLISLQIDNFENRYAVINGVFENPILEEAAARIEQQGYELDRYNLTVNTLTQIYSEISFERDASVEKIIDIAEQQTLETKAPQEEIQEEWLSNGVTFG